jgi:hypothetical protein
MTPLNFAMPLPCWVLPAHEPREWQLRREFCGRHQGAWSSNSVQVGQGWIMSMRAAAFGWL